MGIVGVPDQVIVADKVDHVIEARLVRVRRDYALAQDILITKGAVFWRPQTSVVAAKALGILDHGIASVRVEVVETSVSTNR